MAGIGGSSGATQHRSGDESSSDSVRFLASGTSPSASSEAGTDSGVPRALLEELARVSTLRSDQRVAHAFDDHGRDTAQVGARLAEFLLETEIDRGASGIVYRATDTTLHRLVAIKVLRKRTGRRRMALHGEAQTGAAVSHPNVAAVFRVDEAGGFIVMELVEGAPLRRVLRERKLDLRDALQIARQIAAGLACAHTCGIIHRDLSPNNVMVKRDGTVKLLDFGLAVRQDDSAISGDFAGAPADRALPGRIVGTPGYMSPEQAAGLPVDIRTDVFTFGVLLRQLTDAALVGSVSPGAKVAIDAVVRRCTASARDDRYASAGVVAAALEQAIALALAPQLDHVPRRVAVSRTRVAGFFSIGLLTSAGVVAAVLGARTRGEKPVTSHDVAVQPALEPSASPPFAATAAVSAPALQSTSAAVAPLPSSQPRAQALPLPPARLPRGQFDSRNPYR